MARISSADAAGLLASYLASTNNPDLRAYTGDLARELVRPEQSRWLWMLRYLMELGRIQEARVLDVGCGFGLQAVMLALLGNNRVIANDVRQSMTREVCELVETIRARGESIDVEVRTGDICELPLEPESLDVVFSNQTIEHVHDLAEMFAQIACVLRPGGRCVIADDNNALCPRQMEEVEEMWHKRDGSQEYVEQLKHERPIENAEIEPYCVMRERIIRNERPDLPRPTVGQLAQATAGMLQREIASFVRRYEAGAALPSPPRHAWCRNSVTGEYCERQLDPLELRRMLARAGLRAEIRHAFRRFPLRWFNRAPGSVGNKLLFRLRPVFVLVAHKP